MSEFKTKQDKTEYFKADEKPKLGFFSVCSSLQNKSS